MYVTIIRKGPDDPPYGVTAITECDRVRIQPDPEKPEARVLVSMERDAGGGHAESHLLEKSDAQVYVMNTEGRTIDSYRWQ